MKRLTRSFSACVRPVRTRGWCWCWCPCAGYKPAGVPGGGFGGKRACLCMLGCHAAQSSLTNIGYSAHARRYCADCRVPGSGTVYGVCAAWTVERVVPCAAPGRSAWPRLVAPLVGLFRFGYGHSPTAWSYATKLETYRNPLVPMCECFCEVWLRNSKLQAVGE